MDWERCIDVHNTESNRKVTFDNLENVIIKNGIVIIRDNDGWGTRERLDDGLEFEIGGDE